VGKGFLALFNEPERVTVAEGFWIDLRTSLSAEDYEAGQRVLLGRMTMTDSKLNSTPDTIGYQHELVFRSIVDWNLTDEEGAVLPLEPAKEKHDSIRRLPQLVFIDLYQRITVASTPRGGQEESTFRDGGDASDPGNESSNGEVPVAAEVLD
jgi:hypothetical protein